VSRSLASVASLTVALALTVGTGDITAQSPAAPTLGAAGSPAGSATPTGDPSAPASPGAGVAIGPIAWQIVDTGKDFDQSPGVYGIGQLPDDRLVVVGSVGSPDEQGAAWVSANGSKWNRLKGLKTPKHSVIYGIGSLDGTSVAVGGSLSDRTGLVWTSTDGTTWTKARHMDGTMYSLTEQPGGLIAVGVEGPAAMAWTTADGKQWSPITLAPSGRAVHVMAGAGGTLVASGAVMDADGASTPVVWTSVDGMTWTQTVLEGLLPGQWSNPAGAATPAGFVVAFAEPGQDGFIGHVWTSADGVTWAETHTDQVGFLSAAGSAGTDAMLIGHGQVLRSPDGVTWTSTPEPTFDGWSVRDVMTLADGRLFAAGDVFSSAMATWTGTAEPTP
jgi:hypothetical protein